MTDLHVETHAYPLNDQTVTVELALQLPPASNMSIAKSRLRVGRLVTYSLTIIWDGMLPFSPKQFVTAGGLGYALSAKGDNWAKYDHHTSLGDEDLL